jgi:hypothetical protein
LAAENKQLLPEQGIFCYQLSLASSQISQGGEEQRRTDRFGPREQALMNLLNAPVAQRLDPGKEVKHRPQGSLSARR